MRNILYLLLMRVRPAQLATLLKRMLCISRRPVTLASGHHFCIDPVSVFGYQLLTNGVYESELGRLVRSLLREGDIFLDVGGNEGYFSVLAASSVGYTGQVHCFEPQARLRDVLRRNLEANDAGVVVVHDVAVSDRAGTVQLFLRPDVNTGSSSMFRHWRFGNACETVPTITLTEFCQRHLLPRIRLVKVDCEGAEVLVIRGAEDILAAVDFIALEYHPTIIGSDSCDVTHRRLRELGFCLAKSAGHCIYFRNGLEQDITRLGAVVSEDWR